MEKKVIEKEREYICCIPIGKNIYVYAKNENEALKMALNEAEQEQDYLGDMYSIETDNISIECNE